MKEKPKYISPVSMHETSQAGHRASTAGLPMALARYVDIAEAGLRAEVPQGETGLYRTLRYHMGWEDESGNAISGSEGKRLRPALVLLVCETVGGRWEPALPAAVAVELVHNFSLIHDDIQDRDRERHNRPTVWSLWGEAQALNGGDAMYSLACRALGGLERHNVPYERVLQTSSSLTRSSLAMLEGQYLDLEFETRLDVSTDEYMGMISRKTGALMSCAMEMGAIAGSGNREITTAFAEAGWHLGNLFQIRDDVLGIWGEAATTGKSTGSDILRKKKTFPVVHAFEKGQGAAAATLRRVYQKDSLTQQDVEEVLEALEVSGARGEAEALVSKLGQQAIDALIGTEVGPEHMEEFEKVVSFLLRRER
jgi:geranylgeranyl diphosphate synthase type I